MSVSRSRQSRGETTRAQLMWDPSFRSYLKVFAHLILFSNRRLTSHLAEREDEGIVEVQNRLAESMPDLNERLLTLQFENAARFAILAMSRHARERGAFRGRTAEFFFNNLLDTIAAVLKAEPSAETLALLDG
ncbi:MAG: hypothetical protein ACC642_07340 [Pseudomonadales bacterium]